MGSRRAWFFVLLALASFVAAAGRASAQVVSNPTSTSVGDLRWLAGKWIGNVGNAVAEEHWSEPGAGALMGMFRWLDGERVSVYEFMLIEQTPEGATLRLKHFNAGLRGWEEKDQSVVLRATEVGDAIVVFERTDPQPRLRISYRRDGADRLVSILERWTGDAPARDTFEYRRAGS